MIDLDMLEAMRQLVEPINARLEKLEMETSGIKVLLDTDIHKSIALLGEGQQIIIDRLPDSAEIEAIEARLSAVEAIMRKHNRDINELKKAQ